MHILHVDLIVKPEAVDAFLDATIANADASVREPGCLAFDVLRDREAPNHFRLFEVYYAEGDHAKHKETAHYQNWAEVMETCLAAPRSRNVFVNVFPEDANWAKSH